MSVSLPGRWWGMEERSAPIPSIGALREEEGVDQGQMGEPPDVIVCNSASALSCTGLGRAA